MDCPHTVVEREAWQQAAEHLHSGEWSLLGLWGEPGFAHMAVMKADQFARLSLACEGGRFPSVGRLHPPAIRLERAMRDLYGLEYKEIARVLDRPLGTVKAYVHRGRSALRLRLRGSGVFGEED